ncbi:MAG: hypothetical protein ACXWWA_04080, partial [Chitinophagaceae bacterium]
LLTGSIFFPGALFRIADNALTGMYCVWREINKFQLERQTKFTGNYELKIQPPGYCSLVR